MPDEPESSNGLPLHPRLRDGQDGAGVLGLTGPDLARAPDQRPAGRREWVRALRRQMAKRADEVAELARAERLNAGVVVTVERRDRVTAPRLGGIHR